MFKMCMGTNIHYWESIALERCGFFHLLKWVKKWRQWHQHLLGFLFEFSISKKLRLSQRRVFFFVLGYMDTILTGWYRPLFGFQLGCYKSKIFRSMWHMHGQVLSRKRNRRAFWNMKWRQLFPFFAENEFFLFLSPSSYPASASFLTQSIYKSLSTEWKQLDKLYYTWKKKTLLQLRILVSAETDIEP